MAQTRQGGWFDGCATIWLLGLEVATMSYRAFAHRTSLVVAVMTLAVMALLPSPAQGSPLAGPTATPVSSGGEISGTVFESFSGFLRGATVTLAPLGWEDVTSVSDGSFSFLSVPAGDYTLVVKNPGCTPFGCYKPEPVTVADSKVFVSIFPNPLATDTPTPTATPVVVGGIAQLPGLRVSLETSPPVSDGGSNWLIAGITTSIALAALATGAAARRRSQRR